MGTLVLVPGLRSLRYAHYDEDGRALTLSGDSELQRQGVPEEEVLSELLRHTEAVECAAGPSAHPRIIAVAAKYGGSQFHGPAVFTPTAARRLRSLIPQAPLHTPHLLALLEAADRVYAPSHLLVVFETSFFLQLPEREYRYGLDADTTRCLSLRRYGFHGIYHDAACKHAARLGRREGLGREPRIVSICLEPKPEVAGVVGGRPVTVTGGFTPMEGLPGHTTCGELDPGAVIHLARQEGWGPDRMNDVLTRQSGLLGLVGRETTLGEVLKSDIPAVTLARNVLRYRILQACGAAIAAMGGIDAIVLSGRCARQGIRLAVWLRSRLTCLGPEKRENTRVEIFDDPLERIVADIAMATLRRGPAVIDDGGGTRNPRTRFCLDKKV